MEKRIAAMNLKKGNELIFEIGNAVVKNIAYYDKTIITDVIFAKGTLLSLEFENFENVLIKES